jgi:hypothetical protein
MNVPNPENCGGDEKKKHLRFTTSQKSETHNNQPNRQEGNLPRSCFM